MVGTSAVKVKGILANNSNSLRSQLNALLPTIPVNNFIDLQLDVICDQAGAGTQYGAMVTWLEPANNTTPVSPVQSLGCTVVGNTDVDVVTTSLNATLDASATDRIVKVAFAAGFDSVDYQYIAVIIRKNNN